MSVTFICSPHGKFVAEDLVQLAERRFVESRGIECRFIVRQVGFYDVAIELSHFGFGQLFNIVFRFRQSCYVAVRFGYGDFMRSDNSFYVAVCRMIGKTYHRHTAFKSDISACKRQAEFVGKSYGIIPEHLVKVADAIGEVGNPKCGDVMKIYLKINPQSEVIEDIKFETFGCAAAIATSSMVTELAKGRTLQNALKITNKEVADELGIGSCIFFGASESGTGARGLHSALENVYESLVGALFLDGGWDVAEAFILRTLQPHLAADRAERPENPKSFLQECVQSDGLPSPAYKLVGTEGPAHAPTFTAVVLIDGARQGRGVGSSKKEAEAEAARDALERLGYTKDGAIPRPAAG